ncbi:MAG: hypothetical protein KJ587_07285 [Alphaproteobacteria bacterium]|nr:hypothetical protein [Alphaproteobacteria bacterium]
METRDLQTLIERLAGLSLQAFERSVPGLLRQRGSAEWLAQLRAMRPSLDDTPEAFWADALIRVLEGDRDYGGSKDFRRGYAEAQYKRAVALFRSGGKEALAAKAFLRSGLAYQSLGNREGWRKALKNRGSVLAILGQGRGSLEHLDQAVRSYERCIAATDKETERALWAELQADLGFALQGIGLINNDRTAYERSAATYEAAANVLGNTGKEAPLWSRAKNSLGATLALVGELQSDPGLILKAIAAYQDALAARPLESEPNLWLRICTNIMHAEQLLAGITRDSGRLRRAHAQLVTQLDAANETRFTAEQRAHSYGQLGTNAQLLGEMERRASDLRAALRFYEQAQAGFAAAAQPYLLARIAAHRAAVQFRLGEIERDAAQMALALGHYERLEHDFPRKERPQLWAYWQQTRGKMHLRLADFENAQDHRIAARRAFEAALEEYRREIYPPQWAETTASLCRTLGRMAHSPEDWRHLAELADDLIEGVQPLALAGLSRAQQRSLLGSLQGFGDLAAIAHIRLGERDRAFAMLALARAVGSDLASAWLRSSLASLPCNSTKASAMPLSFKVFN